MQYSFLSFHIYKTYQITYTIRLLFLIPLFLFSVNSSAKFILQSSHISSDCLDLEIEVLQEPF